MNAYLASGLLLGVGLIVAHLVLERGDAQLESAAVLLISSAAVSTGIKVVVICATATTLRPFGDEDRVYILLGGIALIWVSARTIWNAFQPKRAGNREGAATSMESVHPEDLLNALLKGDPKPEHGESKVDS